MFTTRTVFNAIHFGNATVTLGGGDVGTSVKVELLPSKSTATGSVGAAPIVLDTIAVPALGAVTCTIRDTHPAFRPYGAVRLTSVDNLGNPSLDPFIAYFTVGTSVDPVSGPHCGGTVCRIAYFPPPAVTPTQVIKIVATSVGAAQPVEVRNPLPGGFSTVVNVDGDHSYVWASDALGIDVTGTGLIEVRGQSGIPIAVSVHVTRGSKVFRISPSRLGA